MPDEFIWVPPTVKSPVISIFPAVTTFPVVGSTVKFVPPTVKFAPVTSSPNVASTFPAKVVCPVPVVRDAAFPKFTGPLKVEVALTVRVSDESDPKDVEPPTPRDLPAERS